MNEQKTFQPLAFGEFVDGTFRLLRRQLWSMWFLGLLVYTPFHILLEGWYLQELHARKSFEPIPAEQVILMLMTKVIVVMFLLYPILQNASVQTIQRNKVNIRDLFRLSLRKIGKVFVANGLLCSSLLICFMILSFIIGVPIFVFAQEYPGSDMNIIWWNTFILSTILFLLPGTFLFFRFSLLIPIITIENASIQAVFKRSWDLTRHSFGSILGKVACLVLAILPIQLLALSIDEVLSMFSIQNTWIGDLLSILAPALLEPFIFPLFPLLFILYYWNQRAIKEVVDLQETINQWSSVRR